MCVCVFVRKDGKHPENEPIISVPKPFSTRSVFFPFLWVLVLAAAAASTLSSVCRPIQQQPTMVVCVIFAHSSIYRTAQEKRKVLMKSFGSFLYVNSICTLNLPSSDGSNKHSISRRKNPS